MSLLRRYDALLDAVLAELRRGYGDRLVAVAVFGSVGRGTPRDDSDVDLLIVARDLPDGRMRRVDEFLPMEARLERALQSIQGDGAPVMLSPVFKTPEEVERGSPLFLDMVDDARIVYDPEQFLAAYLDRLRSRLRELGSCRIWFGNAWCWELKPDLKPGEVFSLVTSQSQAQSYLRKARGRLKALAVLRDEGDHSDVVREAQELVELALKGMLRAVGVEPPKFHDVGRLLVEHRGKFSTDVGERLDRAAQISARLRRERELAFYGDIDFVPSEQYSAADAARAYDEAAWIVALAEEVIGALPA